MNYFRIQQETRAPDLIFSKAKGEQSKQKRGSDFLYFNVEMKQYPLDYLLPIYFKPVWMVNQYVKKVFGVAETSIEFTPCIISPKGSKSTLVQFAFDMAATDCLHEETKYDKNGFIQEIVLDERKIAQKKIIKLEHRRQPYLFFDMEVLELLLISGIHEFQYEQVAVAGE